MNHRGQARVAVLGVKLGMIEISTFWTLVIAVALVLLGGCATARTPVPSTATKEQAVIWLQEARYLHRQCIRYPERCASKNTNGWDSMWIERYEATIRLLEQEIN
ncbi:MAG: hypothetical protein JSU72_01845 [Deltaproteobacteria bacterium]|nr:MAG: hypothetical protein JSU72_01845 [Deltaproteobacteria bacterium]